MVGCQYKLFKLSSLAYGGDEQIGKRKVARPFSHRRPVHVVLKSESAKGTWSLLNFQKLIRCLLPLLAKKWHIQLYGFAVVGTHLHLVLRAREKVGFQNFLRALTGTLALKITK